MILTGERTDSLLRVYQVEEKDPWSGFLVAPRGWSGRMPLPSPPAASISAALALWNRHQARLLEDKKALPDGDLMPS